LAVRLVVMALCAAASSCDTILPAPAGDIVPLDVSGDAVAETSASANLLIGGASDSGETFTSLEGCPQVHIIHGPQGGFHIWISVRVRNVSPKKAEIHVRMEDAETKATVKPGETTLTVNLMLAAGSQKTDPLPWYEYTGVPAFVKDPCTIHGRKLRVISKVIDLFGAEQQAEACLSGYLDATWLPQCVPAPGADASSDAGSGTK